MVKNQFGKTIKVLQSNNGGEYVKVHKLCAEIGIQSRYSCPYTSTQNGRAKRKHRHIVETGLTLLPQASRPLSYWLDAFITTTFLINGLPSVLLNGKFALDLLVNRQLNVTKLKSFGLCLLFVSHAL